MQDSIIFLCITYLQSFFFLWMPRFFHSRKIRNNIISKFSKKKLLQISQTSAWFCTKNLQRNVNSFWVTNFEGRLFSKEMQNINCHWRVTKGYNPASVYSVSRKMQFQFTSKWAMIKPKSYNQAAKLYANHITNPLWYLTKHKLWQFLTLVRQSAIATQHYQ